MRLATNLNSLGAHIEVVTARQAASWPDRFKFREFKVHRPVKLFRTGWSGRADRSALRYVKSLKDWIIEHQQSIDLIYCDSIQEECIASVEAARQLSIPSVVRVAGAGQSSDLIDSGEHRNVKRCLAAATKADAIVINSGSIQRKFVSSGYSDEKVCRIPIGVFRPVNHSLNEKEHLRLAMGRINGDLFVQDATSVILSVERMTKDSGIMTLVRSSPAISERINGLQYWYIGDGPIRDAIYSHLKGEGLRQCIAMPGSFAVMDDVFRAADLMVHTGDDGYQHHVPKAVSNELPLVIAASEAACEFFAVSMSDAEKQINSAQFDAGLWWFDSARPRTLRVAIESIIQDFAAAKMQTVALRKRMQTLRDENQSLHQYLQLFRRLIDSNEKSNDHRNQGAKEHQ